MRSVRRADRGQAMVEFALIVPVLIVLLFAVVELARLFQAWQTVQHAAEEGARFAVTGHADCTGITADRPACIEAIAKTATYGLVDAGASGAGVSVDLMSWEFPAFADPGTAGDAGDQCDSVEVKVRYTHRFAFSVFKDLAPSGVTLTGRQRMLNEPYGPC